MSSVVPLATGGGSALTLVDAFTRECPVIEVDTSLPGERVVHVLERLAATRGVPAAITVDNGPELAGKALDAWAYRRGVQLAFITSGKPVENGYIESFNGKFRDECLDLSTAAGRWVSWDFGGAAWGGAGRAANC